MSTATSTPDQHSESRRESPAENAAPPNAQRRLVAVPAPMKHLFDKFPLCSYPINALPHVAPRHRQDNVLYIFTSPEGAHVGAPSYNPGCLKWQTYLKFTGIPFRTTASNNHASPSGALPFLQPSSPLTDNVTKPTQPIPSSKLQRWCKNNSAAPIEEPEDSTYDAYFSLIDHRIRRAWTYAVYLIPTNFASIAEPLYILPTSSQPFVRLSIAHTLQRAAEAELLKHTPVISAQSLYAEADEAFEALDALLGDNDWFFGADKPGLFDASVFAYTHLLLMDEGFGRGWVDTRLRDLLKHRTALVRHRRRILSEFYSDKSVV
ncbi:hypothetical protein M011DRAFT_472552 [Sporormia fimetaria CBS 119925]|uniref:Mitochondrial outer membrane protein n=1 Tax=Sporormia fimetaria CBS 119925 TaxID=1340428 RepID=A0A6A6UWC1_9PLEO|nr:hypothetical protein M011DRAFT_472552 [Sporormia fimetaria CBS 119925]